MWWICCQHKILSRAWLSNVFCSIWTRKYDFFSRKMAESILPIDVAFDKLVDIRAIRAKEKAQFLPTLFAPTPTPSETFQSWFSTNMVSQVCRFLSYPSIILTGLKRPLENLNFKLRSLRSNAFCLQALRSQPAYIHANELPPWILRLRKCKVTRRRQPLDWMIVFSLFLHIPKRMKTIKVSYPG